MTQDAKSTAQVNLVIRRIFKFPKSITPQEYLTFYKGEGYCYFAYDSGQYFETHSVYVNAVNQLTLDQWVEECQSFIEKLEEWEMIERFDGNQFLPC